MSSSAHFSTHRDGLFENVARNAGEEAQWRKSRFDKIIQKTREIRAKQTKTKHNTEKLHDVARWTNHLPLAAYMRVEWLPDIVNVVSLCDLVPIGSTQLPLDLFHIAKTCNGAFYAPGKFAAVQLGVNNPKSRILIFHTGRIVQTGTTSVIAAHNAISLTLKILRDQSNLYLRATNFSIINIVGAVSLNTVFNCSTFADHHTDEVRFDPGNFVGLTWKPTKLDVPIIVEMYSTGRANIPGATREHVLYNSFAKLVPEIIRYSSASANSNIDQVEWGVTANESGEDHDGTANFTDELYGLLSTESIGSVSTRF